VRGAAKALVASSASNKPPVISNSNFRQVFAVLSHTYTILSTSNFINQGWGGHNGIIQFVKSRTRFPFFPAGMPLKNLSSLHFMVRFPSTHQNPRSGPLKQEMAPLATKAIQITQNFLSKFHPP
jgi:hypothetical protein